VSAHTARMEPMKPAKSVLITLFVLLVAAWALIIWVATVVTQTMVETLTYIVELAQMS
jgi:hypothetical protein